MMWTDKNWTDKSEANHQETLRLCRELRDTVVQKVPEEIPIGPSLRDRYVADARQYIHDSGLCAGGLGGIPQPASLIPFGNGYFGMDTSHVDR